MRTTRSVRLTDEGRHFYEQVMPLLAALAEATGSAASNVRKVQGRLRINIDPLFARFILGPRLGTFMDSHPELDIELRTREDLGDLVADGFDVALRYGHPTDPTELENGQHRCILFREPVTGRPFPWEFHQRKKKLIVKPQGALTVNDPGTLYSTCLAGLGIAQLFELGVEQYIASGQLIRLFPDWPDHRFPLYAYYPSRHHVPAKTKALLDFVGSLVR